MIMEKVIKNIVFWGEDAFSNVVLTSLINPSVTFNYPFFLLSSPLRFSFAVLCTTNFSRF